MSCHEQSHYRTKSADYIAYYVQKRVSKFLLKYCTKTETKNNEILISLFKWSGRTVKLFVRSGYYLQKTHSIRC